ncbi:hypothetical protein [Sulfurimonas indica]|uniref:hypothetical protein n=1 Tax=Sulfurimonas TaxID=202746 RepID=UPI00126592E2|nr:hypothetical protein [Sulfurimonas indica]
MKNIQAVSGRQGSKTPPTMSIQHRCENAHKQYCEHKLIHNISLNWYLGGQKKRLRLMTSLTFVKLFTAPLIPIRLCSQMQLYHKMEKIYKLLNRASAKGIRHHSLSDTARVLGRQGSKTPLTMLIQHRCKNAHKRNCEDQLIHNVSLDLILEGKKKGRNGDQSIATLDLPLHKSNQAIFTSVIISQKKKDVNY